VRKRHRQFVWGGVSIRCRGDIRRSFGIHRKQLSVENLPIQYQTPCNSLPSFVWQGSLFPAPTRSESRLRSDTWTLSRSMPPPIHTTVLEELKGFRA
jgi:hypothetical protein